MFTILGWGITNTNTNTNTKAITNTNQFAGSRGTTANGSCFTDGVKWDEEAHLSAPCSFSILRMHCSVLYSAHAQYWTAHLSTPCSFSILLMPSLYRLLLVYINLILPRVRKLRSILSWEQFLPGAQKMFLYQREGGIFQGRQNIKKNKKKEKKEAKHVSSGCNCIELVRPFTSCSIALGTNPFLWRLSNCPQTLDIFWAFLSISTICFFCRK